ncbi:MAG: ribonuclease HI [Lachnospiraceae bacterium]|nr:ribonuclease HI [Lachnospiraceae bacterium]
MDVTIYSDGSSRGNPGPGGFGTVIHYVSPKTGKLYVKELSGGFKETTNNRMELLGAISGLEALNQPCNVTMVSDSQYVVKAFTDNWIKGWEKRQWKNVKNIDLWLRLLKAMEPHVVSWQWVKGHAGHPENERCDKLATQAADSDNLSEDEGFKTNS